MQEGRDDLFLVEPVSRGKIQEVDPVEVAILALCDQLRNGLDHRRIGGLPQNRELGLGIAHGDNLDDVPEAAPQDVLQANRHPLRSKMPCYRGVIANIGERSGCVVTTPIGITGSLSTSVT